jgi:hypothetical protein
LKQPLYSLSRRKYRLGNSPAVVVVAAVFVAIGRGEVGIDEHREQLAPGAEIR